MENVIYCDNHLLCLDKPGGLLSQPSGTSRDSLEARGKAWLKEEFSKPGAVFLEAVHRIDAAACGIVLFARTSKALSRLNEAIRNSRCTKEYRVLVEGIPPAAEGTLRDWLVHDEHRAAVVKAESPGARPASLHYKVLERYPNGTSLLKVLLETGRYHQIRVQFARLGMPVAGDRLYGSRLAYARGCIALQHYCLTVEHPVLKQEMRFVSKQSLTVVAK